MPSEITPEELNLLNESWNWIYYSKELKETGVGFFCKYFLRKHPELCTAFAMKDANDHNAALAAHSVTVMHAIKYVVENARNPEQFRELFFRVGMSHVKYGLHLQHFRAIFEAWLEYCRHRSKRTFDDQTIQAWRTLHEFIFDPVLSGIESAKAALLEESRPPTPKLDVPLIIVTEEDAAPPAPSAVVNAETIDLPQTDHSRVPDQDQNELATANGTATEEESPQVESADYQIHDMPASSEPVVTASTYAVAAPEVVETEQPAAPVGETPMIGADETIAEPNAQPREPHVETPETSAAAVIEETAEKTAVVPDELPSGVHQPVDITADLPPESEIV